MAFVDTLAGWLGVTSSQFITLAIVGAALLAGWTVLRLVLRIALRIFRLGCLAIVLGGLGLYLLFALSG